MNGYTFKKDGVRFVRISRPMAKKLYTAGGSLVLCPNYLNPAYLDGVLTITVDGSTDCDFDSMESLYRAYNCSKAGSYPAFYTALKED